MAAQRENGRPRGAGRPGNRLLRAFTNFHVWVYRRSGGAIMGGSGILLLTTVGRKSGKEHATPLGYLPDGDRYLLIASNGGSDKSPSWWYNLRANPQAKIEIGRRTIPVTAKTADAEERAVLWPRIIAQSPQYAGYQRRTARAIPVIILTPDDA